MRNDKKNPFFTNVGLFSTSLFEYRIKDKADFPKVTDKEVIAVWKKLKTLWDSDSKKFSSKAINESDTEKLFIDKIFSILGYHCLTKTKLGGSSKKENTFPDYTLFGSNTDLEEAFLAEQDYKFSKALCLAEGKKFGVTLNDLDEKGKQKDDAGLPALQLVGYLKSSEVDWGILTNGNQWQVYFRRGQYAATRYFEINLSDLLSHPEPRWEFGVFLYLFSPEAFQVKKNSKTRLDEIYEESKGYGQTVGAPFYQGCKKALNLVFEFYQKQTKAEKKFNDSKLAHQASLIFLFRIIAIRYLEDRGVLPTQSSQYRNISLDVLRLKIEQSVKSGQKYQKSSNEIWQKVKILFKDVNNGTYGIYVGHKGFESQLFEIDFDKFFSSYPMPDSLLSEVIDSICRGDGGPGVQIDFYDMGVEKIGDVYNELLGVRVVENESRSCILVEEASRKKELGSYFTSPRLTNLISSSVIEYLDEKIKSSEDFRDFSFCDNSCGSGHFLRQLIEDISYRIYIHQLQDGNIKSTQNDWRRFLAQNCAYGIDKDINAIWLTKLSLWLLTAENGKPFVFLDHHIVNGDSILSSIEKVDVAENDAKVLNEKFLSLRAISSDTKENVISLQKIWSEIKSITKKYAKHVRPQKDFLALDEESRKTYFTYAEQFPEIFLSSSKKGQGFDIIVGNPPWETVKPKIQDFYKMKTGSEKSLSRKELDAWLDSNKKLTTEYSAWERNIKQYAQAIRNGGYELQSGEVFTYAYFTERSLQSLRKGGLLAYITKLGIYADMSSSKLRKEMLVNNEFKKLWIFRNNKVDDEKMFSAVAPNEKFAVFICEKHKLPTYELQAKTVLRLEDIDSSFLPWQHYKIPELVNENTVEVYDSATRKAIASKTSFWPRLGTTGLKVGSELHLTNERHLFTESETVTPIYTGYELRSFYLSDPENWCKKQTALKENASSTSARIGVNDIIPDSRRKLRASPIPANVLTANSVLIVTGFKDDDHRHLVLASLNSMVTEYVLRPKLSNMHLNNFRLEALPLPIGAAEELISEIVKQCKILQKKKNKEFEQEESYRRIEALMCISYGLTVEEIREYLSSFDNTPKDLIKDVLDYIRIYSDEFKFAKILEFKPKTAFEKTVACRLGVASLIVSTLSDDKNLGRVKFAKVFYLVDKINELQLKTEYVREASGPLDQRALYNDQWGILPLANKYGLFTEQEIKLSKGKKMAQFKPSIKLKSGISFAQEVFGENLKKVEDFIAFFKKLDTDQTELVATVYASWNDLLLQKKEDTASAICNEVLNKWHPSKKKKFTEKQIENCISWMKKNNLRPHGKGKLTSSKDERQALGF